MPRKREINTETLVLGLMSGTSLDGLDMALCNFGLKPDGSHSFSILKSATEPYPEMWRQRLSSLKDASAEKYFAINALYGRYIGEQVNLFLEGTALKPIAIASHGHTVFHQPHAGFSVQTGCGATIAATTGITTICDFRSGDVARGGQGAPLVPLGDKLLFSEYEACLNLGGIANISYDEGDKRVAYDVCVANMLLNYLAGIEGKDYDAGGEMAARGTVNSQLLSTLNELGYYSREGAKSIGREWFEKHVFQLFESTGGSTYDLLATATEHIAGIIAGELNRNNLKNVLLSGGGAFNTFLVERISSKTNCRLIIPPDEIINFKEALIFAFLGFLRLGGRINTLGSVTGAADDSCGGAVYSGS